MKPIAYAVMAASLAALVVTAIACYRTVTGKKLALVVCSVLMFFAAWAAIIVLEKQEIGVVPIAMFLWLSVFVFYFFGLRYVTGRGVLLHKLNHELGAVHAHSESPRLTKMLGAARHLLLWTLVALIVVILARGLMGKGWVMTVSWFAHGAFG